MPAARSERQFEWLAAPFFRWSVGILAAVGLGMLAFEALGISVFSRIGMPHELCYLRDPKLIWLHVISDSLIGSAYIAISATLGFLVFKASKGIPFNWVFLAFGVFIISCGFTHFMEVWVIWEPVYWASGYVKVLTAAASVATATALIFQVPKIFALVRAARESEARRVEIEQLNQELERFNYSVAHDLRGPLRGITGFSQALREDCPDELSPAALGYIDRMQTSVGRMDALISDLLKYATIGRQELRLEPVALDEVLVAATELLDADVADRKAGIAVPRPLPRVMGDATLLQVIFQNLIGNAIKFVHRDVPPQVQITWEPSADHVTVYFTDNGLGIPAEARARVFNMFERFHPEFPGTGIGLRIVHRAIERLQGKIGLGAAPGGKGTQFWIKLSAVQNERG
jgi:signal transduction histidine kinase